MVLITLGSKRNTEKNLSDFRPLAGIMVLIEVYICVLSLSMNFRPLAGIMVLIGVHFQVIEKDGKYIFPSPCGDYGSYHALVK